MIEHNELVTLILGTGCILFIFFKKQNIRKIPSASLLLLSFLSLYISWISSILEIFFWYTFFNVIEHSVATLSAIIITVWCWKVVYKRSECL